MRGRGGRRVSGIVATALAAGLLVGCSRPELIEPATRAAAEGNGDPAPPATVAPTTAAPPTTTAPPARRVNDQGFTAFGVAHGVTLTHPSARVEHIGFHQSNHEGAIDIEPLSSAASPVVLEARERLTGPRTAADIVSDPAGEIRAPATGTVKRAGTYVLYCKVTDGYVVIAPDGQPGVEVKLLHITGVKVRSGQRVVAGETVIAEHPTVLPFESQVDEVRTADPAWPHVHLEVVDLSIPNRPNPGSGSSC